MQPLIGITTYDRTEHPSPSAHYATHYSVPTDYVDAVRRAGGVPVLLPPGEPHTARWLDKLDGVVMSGGTDVAPSRYGGHEDPRVQTAALERDQSEFEITTSLVESTIPALLVCRGIQVLNVGLGGTLHAHLPDVVETDIHRDENGFWTTHAIEATPGSAVAKAMGTERVVTYSGHHQALDRVAERLVVTALAPDGIVEAVELPGHPWLVAVQWHPEVTAHRDPTQQGLFDDLIQHA